MSRYHLKLTPLQQARKLGVRWCLDYPLAEQLFVLDEEKNTLYVQGWLLSLKPVQRIRLVLLQGEQRQYFPLNCERPDVIEAILKQPSDAHPQLRCGFKFTTEVLVEQLRLGVELDGELIELMAIDVTGVFKVLRGAESWLYLDNDTNKSVEQYTGKLLLGKDRLQRWQRYLGDLRRFETQNGIPSRLLIAPSKEMVYPQFYPHQRAAVTPVDQVCQLPEAEQVLVYPELALQQLTERSFRMSDTHWSAPGAKEACMQLALALGVDKAALTKKFQHDLYRVAKRYGDLGKKVFPPMPAEEQILKSFNHRRLVRYDNGLPNFGRVVVTTNRLAVSGGTLLLFGSSSSYSMMDYLSRIFRRVVLVHCAGNLDAELIAQLKPDYLVAQTNARFVVIPPTSESSLRLIMRDKLAKLAVAEQQSLLSKAALMKQKSSETLVNVLHQILEQEVSANVR
ncbi:hypothetical protein Q3O59_08010 [Alkalimonas delamerensis]|uniref:AlgX/AlgJ SGNH hydrolase-like domain-containing protein n=1 Tax=Alkalimonas delamerensis TaxID=265981 RepID=A0ABT9GQP7_9GAMM|nr:hypothetical protein [Alkalimonas delamerensis]MDP4528971.1 hypothetical protein [Alkalimonas delamerensis]